MHDHSIRQHGGLAIHGTVTGPKELFDQGESAKPEIIKLRQHYEKRLEDLRLKNESDRSPEETAKLRGKIAEVKNLLVIIRDKTQIY